MWRSLFSVLYVQIKLLKMVGLDYHYVILNQDLDATSINTDDLIFGGVNLTGARRFLCSCCSRVYQSVEERPSLVHRPPSDERRVARVEALQGGVRRAQQQRLGLQRGGQELGVQ